MRELGVWVMKQGEIYKHHRTKKTYEVLCIADHVKTGRKLVIYHEPCDQTKIWARDYDDFTKVIPKFEKQ